MNRFSGEKRRDPVSIIDQWHEYMKATGYSQASRDTYRRIVVALGRRSGKRPEAVARQDVVAFLARDKPWTKLTYWKAIRVWSNYLIEFDHSSTDLLKGLPKPRTPELVARPISDDVVDRVLASTFPARTMSYVKLALFQGLRVHEIAKLRGEDFDHEKHRLLVVGKGGVAAWIPLHPEVSRLASDMPEFGYWFPSHHDPSGHVSSISVSATVKNALRSVGSMATAHQFRDTLATRVQRSVRDMRVTQVMMRHRSIRSTQKYVAVHEEDLLAAVAALTWGQDAA